MNLNKALRVLEILWLAIGCVGVLLCAYNIVAHDTRGAVFFLIFTFACGMMYAVRRRQRLKAEAAAQKQKEQKK